MTVLPRTSGQGSSVCLLFFQRKLRARICAKSHCALTMALCVLGSQGHFPFTFVEIMDTSAYDEDIKALNTEFQVKMLEEQGVDIKKLLKKGKEKDFERPPPTPLVCVLCTRHTCCCAQIQGTGISRSDHSLSAKLSGHSFSAKLLGHSLSAKLCFSFHSKLCFSMCS